MFDFINTLSESRLIASNRNLRRYSAEELAELAVLYLCGLYILFNNNETEKFARQYAKRTLQYGTHFEQWHSGATDLYAILHGLKNQDVQLDDPIASDKFRRIVPLGEAVLVRWLRDMASGTIHMPQHRALFTRLDFNFKIGSSSLRAIRRLVMDWTDLTRSEHKLAMTRLLQMLRSRGAQSEVLPELNRLARSYNLELHDVCDPETGKGCDAPGHSHHAPKDELGKGGKFLATLAGVGLGVAASSLLHRGK